MTAIPNAYDRLNTAGVLPYDVNKIIYGKPSEYLSQTNHTSSNLEQPKKDLFHKKDKEIEPKKIGLIALTTYLVGAVLSKSKNPIKGAQAMGTTLLKLAKIPLKLLKK